MYRVCVTTPYCGGITHSAEIPQIFWFTGGAERQNEDESYLTGTNVKHMTLTVRLAGDGGLLLPPFRRLLLSNAHVARLAR